MVDIEFKHLCACLISLFSVVAVVVFIFARKSQQRRREVLDETNHQMYTKVKMIKRCKSNLFNNPAEKLLQGSWQMAGDESQRTAQFRCLSNDQESQTRSGDNNIELLDKKIEKTEESIIEGNRVHQEKAVEKQGADFLGFFRSLEDITQVANVQRVSAELFDQEMQAMDTRMYNPDILTSSKAQIREKKSFRNSLELHRKKLQQAGCDIGFQSVGDQQAFLLMDNYVDWLLQQENQTSEYTALNGSE